MPTLIYMITAMKMIGMSPAPSAADRIPLARTVRGTAPDAGKAVAIRRTLFAGATSATALAVASMMAAVPAAEALPAIPDSIPAAIADGATGSDGMPGDGARETVAEPRVSVTREDGTPVTGAVRRGDVLLVHGSGFDPGANRGGYPVPIPPGVPNGVYVLYSAFPDQWKPSEGVPGEAREHPHDRMAWVMPDGTLDAVPGTGVNMRRQLARVSQPMAEDGTFTARITVDPAEAPPGENWGVYVYPAAGSVNAAEELFVPIDYSAEPGPNTPPPSSPDLLLDATAPSRLAGIAGGGVTPKKGAVAADDGRIGFTLHEDSRDPETGHGTVKYRGTADITARFSIVHMVIRDPWLEFSPQGTFITAEVSRGYDVGPDSVRRVRIALVTEGPEGADGTGTMRTTVGDVERVR